MAVLRLEFDLNQAFTYPVRESTVKRSYSVIWTEATWWEYTHLGFWGRFCPLRPCRVSRVDRATRRSRKTYRWIWPDSLTPEPCNHTHVDNGFPTFAMITYIFAFRFTQDSSLISSCPKDSRSLQQSTNLSIISGFLSILLDVEPSLQMMHTLFFPDMAASFSNYNLYNVFSSLNCFVWGFLMHHIVDICLTCPITSSHLKRQVMYEIIPISLE